MTNIENSRDNVKAAFQECRMQSCALTKPLGVEDQTIQTMPDVSPTKWHLAHTSWFFETFLLKEFAADYQEFNPNYNYLFNSYYEQLGNKWARAERGLLSRPSVSEILEYRCYVNEKMSEMIDELDDFRWGEAYQRIILGINHEWQHQELLLTDIKHVLGFNPLRPAAYNISLEKFTGDNNAPLKLKFLPFENNIYEIGCNKSDTDFSFDNETPKHQKLLQPFCLSERLITNGEYLEFIEDGGYKTPSLWLSDGWKMIKKNNWCEPLYWRQDENLGWMEYTLGGEINLQKNCPVTHISFYEAEAFASWADKRLPREEEIEVASNNLPIQGNSAQLVGDGEVTPPHPKPAVIGNGLQQMYGDGWEWTQSAYAPYPKFKAEESAIGEYNGKFMCNQFVLKGGSCATPARQIRATYRNFFPPETRWQFSAIRLADYV